MGGKLDFGPGFSATPDPKLLAASFGQSKSKSGHNTRFSLLRVDQLCKKLSERAAVRKST
jgi:hypothetical protein